jgi:hypothetical protein
MTVSLASLLIQETKEAIYNTGIAVARAVGLPVDSWQAGDPTRSLFHVEAETLSTLEVIVAQFIAAGFLDYATGIWLKLLAEQVFGVVVPAATPATTELVLSNAGGGRYPDIEAGDLTFKNSTTGVTYTNTTGGTIESGPGTTLTVTVVADVLGSDGSAGVGEIDEIVTTLNGVTCSNAAVAVGVDEQDESVTRAQCRAKLDALSPNGAARAYEYILRTPSYSGLTYVPRVRTFPDSDVGEVKIYVAGPAGAISSTDRDTAEDAVLTWCTPLCITPVVASAAGVTVNVTYELWVYASVNKTDAEIQEDVEAALETMFSTRPIGGDVVPPATSGSMYKSLIESTIRGVFPNQAFRVSVTTPASDTALTNSQVAQLGTVTATVNIVEDP